MDIGTRLSILALGIIIGAISMKLYLRRFGDYVGTMFVDDTEEKTVYSLVLDEYPDKLEFKKEVRFKVAPSEKSSNRK